MGLLELRWADCWWTAVLWTPGYLFSGWRLEEQREADRVRGQQLMPLALPPRSLTSYLSPVPAAPGPLEDPHRQPLQFPRPTAGMGSASISLPPPYLLGLAFMFPRSPSPPPF